MSISDCSSDTYELIDKNDCNMIIDSEDIDTIDDNDYLLLDDKQKDAINKALSNQHVFITGEAGTGKSLIIKQIYRHLCKQGKRVALTATTGMAAVNIGGITYHSWSSINMYKQTGKITQEAKKNINDTDVLIIDEISMMNYIDFDYLVELIINYRVDGLMTIIAVGDFYQLSPISDDSNPYDQFQVIFKSLYWNALFKLDNIIFLRCIYRQNKDELYANILSRLRKGNGTEQDLELINKRVMQEEGEDILRNNDMLIITSFKKDAKMINQQKLDMLDTKEYVFNRIDINNEHGDRYNYYLDQVEKTIRLKIGCKVLIIKNINMKKSIVNGKRGTVISIEGEENKESILIQTDNDKKKIRLKRYHYRFFDLDGYIIASCYQFPIILGSAITVHKSQGMNIEKAIIDLPKTFAFGMCYVALSRIISLKGLYLTEPLSPKVFYTRDSKIVKYYYDCIEKNRIYMLDEICQVLYDEDEYCYDYIEKIKWKDIRHRNDLIVNSNIDYNCNSNIQAYGK